MQYVTAADGTQIFAATWTPNGPVVATVTAAHGLGEHILRYEPVFSKFASLGIKVQGIDLRGHGRTVLYGPNKEKKGQLGNTGSANFADVLKDLRDVTARVKVQGVPHFAFGHSMGALITLMYAQKFPEDITGALTNGAPVDANSTAILKIGAGLLSFLLPNLEIASGLDSNLLTHSVEEVEKYKADPYVHGKITPRTAQGLFSGGSDLLKHPETFNVPMLLTIGSEDRICRPSGVQSLFDKLSVQDKSIKIFDGLYHECHNELTQRDNVVKTWSDWILSRSSK
ncbi:Alpha/Beta hydrolase protein [Cladochytrium replicatum]|nr:Alpha/Beta hydrolase protein [Cladochytrium replicatum]